MTETNRGSRFLRRNVGLAGEAVVFGVVLALTAATVLSVNGNSLAFSALTGVGLGVAFGALRYVVQQYRGGE